MKLDLSEKIKDLNGEILKISSNLENPKSQDDKIILKETDIRYADHLSTLLGYQTTHISKFKAFEYSKALYKNGFIEIDKSDLMVLKKEIEETKVLHPITQVPIITNSVGGYILSLIYNLLNPNPKLEISNQDDCLEGK